MIKRIFLHRHQNVPNYNDRNHLKEIAYNRVLVKRILPRAANISQILQIPLHFPKKRKKKEKKFD